AVDKVHLVPFGEYIPFARLLSRLGVEQFVAGPMNFSPGSNRRPLELPGGIAASAFICYEVIFPELVASDATSTGLIMNVTNDAWFGDTPGPYQHFRQAQIRAVENAMPLLRSANNGISGVIDARGRVVDALALNARASLDIALPVPGRSDVLLPWRSAIGGGVMTFVARVACAGLLM